MVSRIFWTSGAFCWALLFTQTLSAQQVDVGSLLDEMISRDEIARFPVPAYNCKQFSSYSRVASDPQDKSTWFHNEDWSNYVRVERKKDGRFEHVMVDADGPGAIVRIWVTVGNPMIHNGILRVYLDGQEKPVIEGKQADLVSKGALVGEPLSSSSSPQTDFNRRGHNLYLPIPYAKHCKITYQLPDGSKIDRRKLYHYYNINYRTYTLNTNVKTFQLTDLETHREKIDHVQTTLRDSLGSSDVDSIDRTLADQIIKPGKTASVDFKVDEKDSGRAVREIELRLDARNLRQALRSTVLEINFDGQRTVWCPVGDFFGTGYQIRPTHFWYGAVDTDGTLTSHWTMPFSKTAKISLHNLGKQPVRLPVAEFKTGPWTWDSRSMYFGTSWHQLSAVKSGGANRGHSGAGAYDMNFVTLSGKGIYVGDTLTQFDGAQAWWGEGDEKVFVDGEKYPSHFGTGTEDYYGYAWCRGEKFQTPFITQPDGTGDLGVGYVVNGRYRLLDGIPFEKSLKFDMEQWHWAETYMNIAPTTYWYVLPGSSGQSPSNNIEPDLAGAKFPVAIHPSDVFPTPTVSDDGTVEGEDLKINNCTGGTADTQALEEPVLSNNAQLWWRNASEGDTLNLSFKVPESMAGNHDLRAQLATAVDYGAVEISINEKVLVKRLDGYSADLSVQILDLGQANLLAGENCLKIKILKANPNAQPGNMFGIDYLQISTQ